MLAPPTSTKDRAEWRTVPRRIETKAEPSRRHHKPRSSSDDINNKAPEAHGVCHFLHPSTASPFHQARHSQIPTENNERKKKISALVRTQYSHMALPTKALILLPIVIKPCTGFRSSLFGFEIPSISCLPGEVPLLRTTVLTIAIYYLYNDYWPPQTRSSPAPRLWPGFQCTV